jgi:hypothetical protein
MRLASFPLGQWYSLVLKLTTHIKVRMKESEIGEYAERKKERESKREIERKREREREREQLCA